MLAAFRPDSAKLDKDSEAVRLDPAVITIDGPAASGKSTVGRLIAERLDFLFFDTGVMYRAVTWVAIAHGVNPEDATKLGELAEQIDIDIEPPDIGPDVGDALDDTTSNPGNRILADGADITEEIRLPVVDQNVSAVAAAGRVREALTTQQRRIGEKYGRAQTPTNSVAKKGVVMVGRDIGTVVMPDAPVKIYMDASVEERARRRYLEIIQKKGSAGESAAPSFEQVLEDIRRRDRLDSERALSPLRVPNDAYVIDTSDLSPDEVVELILRIVEDMTCR